METLRTRIESDSAEVQRLETFLAGIGEFDEYPDGAVIMGEYAGSDRRVPQVWIKHQNYWYLGTNSSDYSYKSMLDNLSDPSIVQVSIAAEWSVVYPPGAPE